MAVLGGCCGYIAQSIVPNPQYLQAYPGAIHYLPSLTPIVAQISVAFFPGGQEGVDITINYPVSLDKPEVTPTLHYWVTDETNQTIYDNTIQEAQHRNTYTVFLPMTTHGKYTFHVTASYGAVKSFSEGNQDFTVTWDEMYDPPIQIWIGIFVVLVAVYFVLLRPYLDQYSRRLPFT